MEKAKLSSGNYPGHEIRSLVVLRESKSGRLATASTLLSSWPLGNNEGGEGERSIR